MRTETGSSHLPAPALAKATHWEEGAMTNPDIAHPAILHASDDDTGIGDHAALLGPCRSKRFPT